MRVLIDTNILADVLLGRDPYYDIAYNILTMCADKKIYGYIAAHSVPNLFYILRKIMTKEERREALKDICQIVKVEGIVFLKYFLPWIMRTLVILKIVFRKNVLLQFLRITS